MFQDGLSVFLPTDLFLLTGSCYLLVILGGSKKKLKIEEVDRERKSLFLLCFTIRLTLLTLKVTVHSKKAKGYTARVYN